jgi:hypothetical protein
MFQKVLTGLFADLLFVLVYIDDIVVFSKSYADHARHILKVLEVLNGANLRINESKCIWAKTEILILGYMISEAGIKVCQEKVLQIQDWSTPTSGKYIQQHLGFFNYFRETIPNYASLFHPLEKLRYAKSIVWKPEFQKIYDTAFKVLSSDLVLSYPDFNYPFCVGTDASNYGIGAVLYQVIDNKKHYISFASRAIKESESSYGATKRNYWE